MKYCDAVFEGGGMRGIGLVGACLAFERAGYKFRRIAGSSAGAIVASLIAAGYTAEEMYQEMKDINFKAFKHRAHGIGPIGMFIGANKNFGLYSTDVFEKWLEELLARKNVHTFADVGDRLKITASDITDEKVLTLPDDLAKFGIDTGTFKITTAVRMSMSIPVFYEPYALKDANGNVHYIVDGGLLSNYPVWILDNGTKKLNVPVFGFRFTHHCGMNKSKRANLFSYVKQVVTTIIEAHDDEYQAVMRGDAERTIYIDTMVGDKVVGITDFDLAPELIEDLFNNGQSVADTFLSSWDFKKWTKKFRK